MKKYWTTINGIKLEIVNMETSHIQNCINMLEDQIEEMEDMDVDFIDASGDSDMTYDLGVWDVNADINRKKDYIKSFKRELKRRIELVK